MSAAKKFVRALVKPFRDLASILYDDLDFQVMSLPRVGTALITLLIVWLVADWLRTRVECPYFTELCALDSALWATYLFKRRGNPPEETYCDACKKGGAGDVDMDKDAVVGDVDGGGGMDSGSQEEDCGGDSADDNSCGTVLQKLLSYARNILAKVGVRL